MLHLTTRTAVWIAQVDFPFVPHHSHIACGCQDGQGTQTLLVKSDDDGPATVEIYTTDGRLLERRSVAISNGTARLSVAHLPAGFYVARASDQDNAHVSCKFVK